jgi:oxygen-independent coproporphyrinogen III oxidase
MVASIIKEITLHAGAKSISTIYFGGGTPSILSSTDLNSILAALRKKFSLNSDIEITLEANPDDISSQKLKEWKAIGINRLSMGIQSFADEELKWMNRTHTAAESLACIDHIREAGISNFSVDLIYGSPLLSDAGWKQNVEAIIKRNIPHVSCYALTVEPKTALYKMIVMKKKEPVDPEKQARQFLLLMEWMGKAGYEHYEISNFAKPGLRSKHNSSYWLGESYYGFGPSAHSFDGKKRRWNLASNNLYIQSIEKGVIPFEEEILSEIQQLNEYIMTSLRTMEGLNLNYVTEQFGEDKTKRLKLTAKKYIDIGKMVLDKEILLLQKEGKLFADGIAADLFF